MKKLTPRERALIRHATRKALAEFKAATTLTLEIVRSDEKTSRMVIRQMNLAQLEAFNTLEGNPPFTLSLGGPWRFTTRIRSKLESK